MGEVRRNDGASASSPDMKSAAVVRAPHTCFGFFVLLGTPGVGHLEISRASVMVSALRVACNPEFLRRELGMDQTAEVRIRATAKCRIQICGH